MRTITHKIYHLQAVKKGRTEFTLTGETESTHIAAQKMLERARRGRIRGFPPEKYVFRIKRQLMPPPEEIEEWMN